MKFYVIACSTTKFRIGIIGCNVVLNLLNTVAMKHNTIKIGMSDCVV